MKHFFFTGLARSGTTWTANFFTHGRVFCHHEALVGCSNMTVYRRRLEGTPGEVVGDSDSGLVWHMRELRAEFPDSPIVVIDRNPFDVMVSMKEAGGPPLTRAFVEAHIQAMKEADVVVPFADLFSENTCRALWAKLCPFESFSRPRWEMLTRIRVEPDLKQYLPWYEANLAKTMKGEAA